MTAIYPLRRSSAVQRDLLNPAARLGLTARALMYLLIGVLSILVAAGHSTAETDQWGAMQQLNRSSFGHLLLWAVALGLACYSLWRFSESFFGVAREGKKVGPRLKSLARGCIYAVIAFMAFQIVAGAGVQSQAGRQVTLTSQVMRHPGGRIVVGLVGADRRRGRSHAGARGRDPQVREIFDLSDASAATRRMVEVIGVAGTTARGAVFALAGIFVIQAAWDYEPKKAAGWTGRYVRCATLRRVPGCSARSRSASSPSGCTAWPRPVGDGPERRADGSARSDRRSAGTTMQIIRPLVGTATSSPPTRRAGRPSRRLPPARQPTGSRRSAMW